MSAKAHPSDWRNASPRAKRLALVALLGVVGGILLVNHFSAEAARTVGPTLIARNAAGDTLLANGSTLFLVDAGETRTLRIPAGQLGLHGPVMSVSSDGKDWYLGDDETGMLHRCDLDAGRCEAALRPAPGTRVFRRAHHVAFAGERIFVTDSEAHRVVTFGRDGVELGSSRTGPLPLCFPNGIVALDDSLFVADTNNFRIARLATATPSHSTTLLRTHVGDPIERANCNARSVRLAKRGTPVLNTLLDSENTVQREARPPARPDRVWPASLLHASTGEWWLIQMANRMRLGDVIRYGADGKPLGRIELPPDADPIDLVEARGEVLITDAGLTRVHRVALDGQVSGEWGPEDFRGMLGDIDAQRRARRTGQYLSYALIGCGGFAALAVIVIELRRRKKEEWSRHGVLQPVAIEPAPLGHGPTWIPFDPDAQRRIRRVSWTLGALLIVPMAYLFYLLGDARVGTKFETTHAITLGAALFAVVGSIVLSAIAISRMPRRRLGVTSSEVRYDPGSGTVVTSRWEDVRVSSNTMLIGRHLLQIIDPQGRYFYPQAEVEARILSRLPPSAFVGNLRILLETLRRGNVALWVALLAFALYLALAVLRWTQPEWLQQMGARVADWLR